MPEFNIGFPLTGVPWQFVLVRMLNDKDQIGHVRRWLDGGGSHRPTLESLVSTGAWKARMSAPHADKGQADAFEFMHVSAEARGMPKSWAGTSDTAACALVLARDREHAQSDAPRSPTVLISCDCSFGPGSALPRAAGYDVGYRWTRLRPVSDSDSRALNREALRQKWDAAINGARAGVPVMALVLHEDDAALLAPLLGRQPRPLTGHVFRKLADSPAEWPVLVSVGDLHMPLLARVLGIAPDVFQTSLPIDGPQSELVEYFFHVFAEDGLKLSTDDWEQAMPKMLEALDQRLTYELLPLLTSEESEELVRLMSGLDEEHGPTIERRRQVFEFWARVGQARPEQVTTIIQDFGATVKESFREYAERNKEEVA